MMQVRFSGRLRYFNVSVSFHHRCCAADEQHVAGYHQSTNSVSRGDNISDGVFHFLVVAANTGVVLERDMFRCSLQAYTNPYGDGRDSSMPSAVLSAHLERSMQTESAAWGFRRLPFTDQSCLATRSRSSTGCNREARPTRICSRHTGSSPCHAGHATKKRL
jgi:hypothetical protein